MSREYTITIESCIGRDWLLGNWYWTVDGLLATQADDALFGFELARGFARSEARARRKALRAVEFEREKRAAHLNRIVIRETA